MCVGRGLRRCASWCVHAPRAHEGWRTLLRMRMSAHSICSHMSSTTCRELSPDRLVPRSGRSCSLFRFSNSSCYVAVQSQSCLQRASPTRVANAAARQAASRRVRAARLRARCGLCTARGAKNVDPSTALTIAWSLVPGTQARGVVRSGVAADGGGGARAVVRERRRAVGGHSCVAPFATVGGTLERLRLRDERVAKLVAHLHAPKGWF